MRIRSDKKLALMHAGEIKPVGLIVVLAVTIVLAVGIFFFLPKRAPVKNGDEQTQMISPQQAAQYREIAITASGYLENQSEDVGLSEQGTSLNGFLEAEKRYVQLAQALPEESLPVRNLAIAQTMYLTNVKFEQDNELQAWAKKTRQTIDRFKELEPESAVPFLLSASIGSAADDADDEAIIADLRQAAKLKPDQLGIQYALYTRLYESGAEPEQQETILENCYRIAPRNVDLFREYATHLVRQRSPKLKKLLEDSGSLIATAGNMFKLGNPQVSATGNPFSTLVDQALVAIDQADWSLVNRKVLTLCNQMNGLEIQKIDHKKLVPVFLEYLARDFSDDFYNRIDGELVVPDTGSQDISQLLAKPLVIEGKFRDFVAVDFNRDVYVDFVGIEDQSLVVLTQQEARQWTASQQFPLMGEFGNILAADLDRDRKVNPVWQDRIKSLAAPANRKDYLAEDPADPDFVVYGESGLRIILNRNDGLEYVPQSAFVRQLTRVTAAALIDIEADSDLDLVVACEQGLKILINPGNNRFVDFSDVSVLPGNETPIGSMTIVDWNRDVDVDLVLGDQDGQTIGVLENIRHGRFHWNQFPDSFSKFRNSRSLHAIESDGNRSWDLIGCGSSPGWQICTTDTNQSQVSHQGTRTFGKGSYQSVIPADLDNDACTDVLAQTENRIEIFQGDGTGDFSDVHVLDTRKPCQAIRANDVDYDGDVDLFAATADGILFFENQSTKNGWLQLIPVGISESKGRVNHNGIGSLVEVVSQGRYQAQTITSERLHFGIGKAKQAEQLRILWTNGMPQNVMYPESRLVIRETMFELGSCPFLYTWNGERFEFVTDCLWAAPIGLQVAERVVAPTRNWEYLKVSGEALKPKGGFYEIQITEELWEAAFFDHLKLIAIDHPADVDIFTNEKVGPPSIAQPRVFAVANKRLPVSATDPRRTNVLDQIEAEDGVYMQGFQQTINKGLTPMHYLELDLGEFPERPEQLTLFLTGWIRPTDSSLNVAFSQHPEINGPVPPQIFVPDQTGTWNVAVAPMGFPGGKTKTIAVDLSDVFKRNDYRLRVQTSAEIYWDHVFFAANEPDHKTSSYELPVANAEIHYRGFSKRFHRSDQSPEWYDYESCSTAQRWPPIQGRFTRYGDVKELLVESDDCQVVLGAGDEMTVRFAIPAASVPSGWRRDFVLHCVGYDKDANLNTYYGQSTEPLPFQAMKSYPYSDGEQFPDTEKHRDYLRRFQHRKQDWNAFWK